MTGSAFQWIPNAGNPIGYVTIDGKIYSVTPNPTFYRFLWTLAETKLGGASAATLPDVSQAAQTNAESLKSTKDVLVSAAVPGAEDIPRPIGTDGNPSP